MKIHLVKHIHTKEGIDFDVEWDEEVKSEKECREESWCAMRFNLIAWGAPLVLMGIQYLIK